MIPPFRTPHGLAQIEERFGDIDPFIKDDGTLDSRWNREKLVTVPLPFAIPLAYSKGKAVCRRITCHKELEDLYPALFREIERRGFRKHITTFGGCFNFRMKRRGSTLSTHSWGIAHDINPETNAQGSPGNMPAELIDLHAEFGFVSGMTFTGKSIDPMHFQFASGY